MIHTPTTAQDGQAAGSDLEAGSTRLLTAEDVAVLSDWNEAIDALRDAYGKRLTDAMVPPRSMARDTGVWLRGLSAISPSGEHMGTKLISFSSENGVASYLVALFDRATTQLTALIDGSNITGLRTAATSAMFVELATSDEPLSVGVVGSGFEAYHHLAAVASVRKISRVVVYSPTAANREAFAQRALGELGVETTAVNSAEAAVDGVDVLLCAARSRGEQPTIQGAWLRPGMTVVSIGSTLPEQREVDTETLAKADIIVADMVEEVVEDTGDFLAARDAGVQFEGKVHALADVAAGLVAARPSAEAIVLYKSVGTAVQDVVVAELLLKKSRELGIGHEIAAPIRPVRK